jgi:hypothetical protein
MKRFLCGLIFLLTFPVLLVLAGLVSLLRGAETAIAWVADLATPLVFKMAEIADGRDIADQG